MAKHAGLYAVAVVVLCVVIVPLLFSWLGGFRTNQQLVTEPVGLPDPWVLQQLHGASSSHGRSGASSGTAR